MLKQYWAVRNKLDDDTILFFRMGDFYELFFKDAEIGAKELGIALTSRKTSGSNYPLAGVPIRSADSYIARLVKKGYKVAIVEQLEDPALAKGVVKRDLVRIITKGTIVEEGVLKEDENNFLASIIIISKRKNNYDVGLAVADISTGDVYYAHFSGKKAIDNLQSEIARLSPAEILLPRKAEENPEHYLGFKLDQEVKITFVEDYWFDPSLAENKIKETWEVAGVESFGLKPNSPETAALGSILRYLEENLLTKVSNLKYPRQIRPENYLMLDRTAIRSLELIRNMFDETKEGSLLSVFNHSLTPMGARKLVQTILKPLRKPEEIKKRLDAVEALINDSVNHHSLRAALSNVSDLERLATRISLNTAKPPELVALKNSLMALPLVKSTLKSFDNKLLNQYSTQIDVAEDIVEELERAIQEEPSRLLTEGGIIKDGYDPELDNYRKIMRQGNKLLEEYQEKERKRTNIPNLKIGFNRVFGYYIEVSKSHLSKVPPDYIRKQSLTNAERFITPELKELEEELLTADEKAKKREEFLFLNLRELLKQHVHRIQKSSEIIAMIDVLSCFAKTSEENDYVKPEVDDSDVIEIVDGRHPVLEQILDPEPFVPNSLFINKTDSRFLIVTGPNLSGKSTYLRQSALIIIMAQAGCFVPAKKARIGVVDRIFTRIGAFDNIARGQSTFMLEMQECANILANTTGRSFIVLDEIGRGTSTYDGLSIAWAIAEALHDMKDPPRTILATHYHQLSQLEQIKEGVKNYHTKIEFQGEKLVFVRKILPGSTDKSFGIQVARLAGIPEKVTKRAQKILEIIESGSYDPSVLPKKVMEETKKQGMPFQPTLLEFLDETKTEAITIEKTKEPLIKEKNIYQFTKEEQEVIETLLNLNINKITPIEALNILAKLKGLLEKN